MSMNVANLTATTEEAKEMLGHLVWYTIVEEEWEREQLRVDLEKHGLGEYMPRPISPLDAFRRATTEMKESRVKDPTASTDEDICLNVLVRDVASDEKEIVRNLVIERVDRGGKKLSYEPEVAVVRLVKATEKIEAEAHTQFAQDRVNTMLELYERYCTAYNARAIREIIAKILGDLSPTPVRPSGGVYFVPKQHKEKLQAMIGFINEQGNSEAFRIPLVDSMENVDMIRQKMSDCMTQLAAESAVLCKKKDISPSLLQRKMREIKKLVEQSREYERALSIDMSYIETAKNILKRQATTMLLKLSEIETDRATVKT